MDPAASRIFFHDPANGAFLELGRTYLDNRDFFNRQGFRLLPRLQVDGSRAKVNGKGYHSRNNEQEQSQGIQDRYPGIDLPMGLSPPLRINNRSASGQLQNQHDTKAQTNHLWQAFLQNHFFLLWPKDLYLKYLSKRMLKIFTFSLFMDSYPREGKLVVTIQSRVARDKFGCGPGVRAERAGSIGRDGPRFADNSDSPQGEAGGLGPRLLGEEITA
jgi:hypothetical protein